MREPRESCGGDDDGPRCVAPGRVDPGEPPVQLDPAGVTVGVAHQATCRFRVEGGDHHVLAVEQHHVAGRAAAGPDLVEQLAVQPLGHDDHPAGVGRIDDVDPFGDDAAPVARSDEHGRSWAGAGLAPGNAPAVASAAPLPSRTAA